MKNVLMILFFLGGLAMHDLDAQKGCNPCPPGCCISSCCISGKGSAAAATGQPVDVSFASWVLNGEEPNCQTQKLTKKEMKSCLASCKALGQTAPSDNIHTADASYSSTQPEPTVSTASPACQPLCKTNPACKTTSVAGVDPVLPTREKSKS